jgi:hypothetical protein
VSADANVDVTGEQATSDVGSVFVALDLFEPVTGNEATASLGEVEVLADANVDLEGLLATMALGDIIVSGTWDPVTPSTPSGAFAPIPTAPSAGWTAISDPTPDWEPVITTGAAA